MGRSYGVRPYTALPGGSTMRKARKMLRDGLGDHGIICPCCQQLAKIYKRRLTASMAFALILIYRHFAATDPGVQGWVHVPKLLNGHGVAAAGGDFAKLAAWKLIEERPGEREDGSHRNGEWRITRRGQDFVRGVITVPAHCYFYNQKPIAFPPQETSIQAALGEKFRYDQLMYF